jgi:sulfoxide reductase heme-binding subunit YedZ
MRARRIELCVAGLWIAALALVAATVSGDGDAYSYAWAWTRGAGFVALASLCAALCVSPLAPWIAMRRPISAVRWRRALGLAAVGGGTVHAVSALTRVPGCLEQLFSTPGLRAGAATLLILAALGVTSFPGLVRRLGLGAWKELHRLAYVALPLALFHALHGAFAAVAWLSWLGAITLAVSLLRVLRKPTASTQKP